MLHCRSHYLASSRRRLPSASAKGCVLLPRKPAIVCQGFRKMVSHFHIDRLINLASSPTGACHLNTFTVAPVVPLLFNRQARSLSSK